jgi:hypothetical protein
MLFLKYAAALHRRPVAIFQSEISVNPLASQFVAKIP